MPGPLWKRLLWLLLFTALPLPSAANERLMLERVQALLYERASTFGEEVVIEVSPPSARLGECENPTPFLPNPETELRSRVSVGVRCGEDARQVRYLQASVEMVGRYVEVVKRVERGQPLRESDLTLARGNLGRLPGGTVMALEDAIGQHATRPLAPGQTLQEHHVQSPRLVYRRDSVQVEAAGTGFRVQREGEAIDEGGMGDSVRVRLPDRLILEGRVVGPGRVSVDF
ncbi:flagellar basal body P-ring formation chaperone FlgA [Halomonas sp.]|uniref:flagellar basal body P-ring formation chaperone FlgA n=1 Tax=Halomonas sp. TaxID=1486246 RepID=UPI00298EB925|nr:flagellar basal body P-ring formation chaperone FlgA [Halomonas sp.]MDW7745257.1 flagellar basal body P-ring formation chaperone FlgA [Halomonas sp.]